MGVKIRLTAVEEIPENGSFLFTVRERDGTREEVILVRGEGCIEAWKNFCQHETDQRLDRGFGAAMREGEIICPKHGSMFDACSGYCDNGKAAGSTLVPVDVTVDDGVVYLTDDECAFLHEGGIEDDDGMPGSSSHLTF
ncbi:Rieske (2Fe-2S) protein [Haladaptatus salinisoli]|uniref:Rieske (2Fe-2S) protein n=1 Tax=Haladaptatus salinisoli TaxID=2884876 RepID=UPI001D0A79D0|nr:Rieske 2Fe-2S domain-containing protein [Haladaptatus salinisoli]